MLQVKWFSACQEEEEADQENKTVFAATYGLFYEGLSQEKIHKTIINS